MYIMFRSCNTCAQYTVYAVCTGDMSNGAAQERARLPTGKVDFAELSRGNSHPVYVAFWCDERWLLAKWLVAKSHLLSHKKAILRKYPKGGFLSDF